MAKHSTPKSWSDEDIDGLFGKLLEVYDSQYWPHFRAICLVLISGSPEHIQALRDGDFDKAIKCPRVSPFEVWLKEQGLSENAIKITKAGE